MNLKHKIYSAVLAIVFTGNLSAQIKDETFVFEGLENVKITKQERIAHLPSSLELKMNHSGLQYSDAGVPADVNSFLMPLSALPWKDSCKYDDAVGYFDFGMGSYLDIIGSAGLKIINCPNTKLGIRLQHNSSTAFAPFEDEVNGLKPKKRRLFDEYVGIYGSHTIEDMGRIDASLNYRMGYFNYYALLTNKNGDLKQPSQTVNSFDAAVRFSSLTDKRLQWNIGLEYNYFGYRRLYLREISELPGLKQNLLAISGGLQYDLDASNDFTHQVGTDLRADLVLFADNSANNFFAAIDSYSRYRIAPYYSFRSGNFSGKIGTNLDLAANAGPKYNRYGVFHIAPDLAFGLRAGKFGITLSAEGGVELNTLQRSAGLDRYCSPWLWTTTPIYSPIDGKLTFSFGNFNGLSANLGVAYKITNNQPLDGFYMQIIDGGTSIASVVHPCSVSLKGYSLQASLQYVYRQYLETGVEFAYQPQKYSKGYFNGLDRPRWVLDAKLAVNPVENLRIEAQFQYRGVRNLYGLEMENISTIPYSATRLPDVTNLSCGVSYGVIPRLLTLWVRADNLLGTNAYLNPMLPMPGVAVTGGVQLQF